LIQRLSERLSDRKDLVGWEWELECCLEEQELETVLEREPGSAREYRPAERPSQR
jgi:hypothetical protein